MNDVVAEGKKNSKYNHTLFAFWERSLVKTCVTSAFDGSLCDDIVIDLASIQEQKKPKEKTRKRRAQIEWGQ